MAILHTAPNHRNFFCGSGFPAAKIEAESLSHKKHAITLKLKVQTDSACLSLKG
jgi:hypothetical protein